jgi:hypothetical protein
VSVAHQDESYSYWIDQATCDPLSLYDDVVISYMSDDQLAEINAIDPQARPAEDHSPPPVVRRAVTIRRSRGVAR